MQEIERKFLVKDTEFLKEIKGSKISQAYIFNEKTKGTLRVRIYGDQAFLTLKGKTQGISRSEFEYEIPLEDAKAMIAEFSDNQLIEKLRYEIPQKRLKWEVDVFTGKNEGLIIAEIELDSEDQEFDRPEWLGEEVSHDKRYINALLIQNPYQDW